ncbi:cysteine desulfurase [Ectothiorhodospiraceae bacterium WFHF3C12]|nr:cysteine desulfurase [Ectothiorhodospiraceae bacterium WFHF3C12]
MSTPTPVQTKAAKLDVERLRQDFPILRQEIAGKPLAYLDNAASVQKPEAVIQAVERCYREYYANIHRGVHALSQRSTEAYEAARAKVADFLGAEQPAENVFVRGTTEAINLVAQSFVRPRLKPGDEILITGMEHHSNIVPWQLLRDETGAQLNVVPLQADGTVRLEDFEARLNERTRFVSVVHVSNALGTVNPVKEMIRLAHERGVPVLVDGAQAVPHMGVDVRDLDADFYCFSGHKLYGPTGIGVLYGRMEHLKGMRPYQGGGDMIRYVTFEKTDFAEVPQKFEAGTPNIVGTIGLGAAIDYLQQVGLDAIAAHEADLLDYATRQLSALEGVRIYGTAPEKAAVVSFTMDQAHPHDIGTILDMNGVAIRAGHHCAQPVMDFYGVAATARASFGLYNTHAEVDALVAALDKVRELFG